MSNGNVVIKPNATTVATFAPTGLSLADTLGLTEATWADNQTCTAGQVSVDANFLYVCTAINTVRRVAASGF